MSTAELFDLSDRIEAVADRIFPKGSGFGVVVRNGARTASGHRTRMASLSFLDERGEIQETATVIGLDDVDAYTLLLGLLENLATEAA